MSKELQDKLDKTMSDLNISGKMSIKNTERLRKILQKVSELKAPRQDAPSKSLIRPEVKEAVKKVRKKLHRKRLNLDMYLWKLKNKEEK